MSGLNQRIKQIRSKLGLSQQKLADLLGVSRNIIADIERGKVKKPNIELVKNLEEKFHINPQWLLTGEGEMYVDRRPKNINQGVVIGGVGDNHNYTITTPIEKLPPDVQVIIEELLAMDRDKRKKVLKCILEME